MKKVYAAVDNPGLRLVDASLGLELRGREVERDRHDYRN